MNLYDLVVVALIVLLVLRGLRAGFAGMLLAWLALAVGLVLAFRFDGAVAAWLTGFRALDPHTRRLVAFVVILMFAGLAGELLARSVGRVAARLPVLGRLNSLAGALLGALLAVLAVCVITALLLTLPHSLLPFSGAVHRSGTARLVRSLPTDWERNLRVGVQRYLPGLVGSDAVPSSRSKGAARSLASSTIAARVDPGLVNIKVTLVGQETQGSATGMVLTSSGVVLTNYHVVERAATISATDIGNGRAYSATILGSDRAADVAVIQLQGASGLQTVPTGDSATVRVGARVIVLGNAGGRGGAPTVARGSVTALSQTVMVSDAEDGDTQELRGLIETSADVLPGDSGGPLVSAAGRVVGMNTAASVNLSGQPTGARGFAIPINRVLAIARRIGRE
jgi:S1-C subfamily serine protease